MCDDKATLSLRSISMVKAPRLRVIGTCPKPTARVVYPACICRRFAFSSVLPEGHLLARPVSVDKAASRTSCRFAACFVLGCRVRVYSQTRELARRRAFIARVHNAKNHGTISPYPLPEALGVQYVHSASARVNRGPVFFTDGSSRAAELAERCQSTCAFKPCVVCRSGLLSCG